jgi:hypothetical protein
MRKIPGLGSGGRATVRRGHLHWHLKHYVMVTDMDLRATLATKAIISQMWLSSIVNVKLED